MGWNTINLNKDDTIIANSLTRRIFILFIVTFSKTLKNQMF